MDTSKILQRLKQIQDPTFHKDIVSLGMIRDIRFPNKGCVEVELVIHAGSSETKESIRKQVLETLQQAMGVSSVKVGFAQPAASSVSNAKVSLPGVRHVIAVASGKGGVGKTTVSVNLACAWRQRGYRVGLLDGDIYGPNIPLMLGVPAEKRVSLSKDEKILPMDVCGMKMISMGVLVAPDQPMIWRGPRVHGLMTQFLQRTAWGELDYLIVDLPPGTGDIQLSLTQLVPLAGVVMVTTSQKVSLLDVRKAVAMFRKTEVPILGILENMSGEMFGSGGGVQLAQEYQLDFLGAVPLEVEVRNSADEGTPVVMKNPEAVSSHVFYQTADSLEKMIEKRELAYGKK